MLNLLTYCHNSFKKSNKTHEEREELAKTCEEFCVKFPVMFARNMTRKMHLLSFVCPEFIRNSKFYYKIYKVEQKGESMHHAFNKLNEQFNNIIDKPHKLFLIIREYEIKNKTKKLFL